MKVVYIAAPMWSPTAEGRLDNRCRAYAWVIWAFSSGYSPECSWLVMTDLIGETKANRERGLEVDRAQAGRCDEVWLVGGRVSSGMLDTATYCAQKGIAIQDYTSHGDWPPGFSDQEKTALYERFRLTSL